MKLNPYAKSARRRAILAHNPDVSTLTAWLQSSLTIVWLCTCAVLLFNLSQYVNSVGQGQDAETQEEEGCEEGQEASRCSG